MSRKLTLVILCGGLLLAMAGLAQAHAGTPQFSRIDSALEAGVIDAEQALLYKFFYVFDPEKLPAGYQPETAGPVKCATPLIIEFENLRGELSPGTVTAIDAMLQEPAGNKALYVSPSGRFRFTYLTTGVNAVPAADTNPANGVPDYVERCATYMDTSWTTEITNLGFTAPPLAPYYEVAFENMDAYGYTTVVSGTRTRIVLENNFTGFPPNDDPDGDVLGAAKVTCAHEFKHASQRATSSWTEGGWVELDATWAEDVVYDATNDFYNYLPGGSGITAPTSSLDAGGTGSYDDCIWQIVMSETWGNQIIVDFWSWRHPEHDPVGDGLLQRHPVDERLVAGPVLRQVRRLELRHADQGPGRHRLQRGGLVPQQRGHGREHLPLRRFRHDQPPVGQAVPLHRLHGRRGRAAARPVRRRQPRRVRPGRRHQEERRQRRLRAHPPEPEHPGGRLPAERAAGPDRLGRPDHLQHRHQRQQRGLGPDGQQAAARRGAAGQPRERRCDPRTRRRGHRRGPAHERRSGRVRPGLHGLRHGPGAGAQVGAARPAPSPAPDAASPSWPGPSS
ncbi:MAG: hypothetical protein IPI34_09670 [bacterium]|nr:hypothetical protein [bacterium]